MSLLFFALMILKASDFWKSWSSITTVLIQYNSYLLFWCWAQPMGV